MGFSPVNFTGEKQRGKLSAGAESDPLILEITTLLISQTFQK